MNQQETIQAAEKLIGKTFFHKHDPNTAFKIEREMDNGMFWISWIDKGLADGIQYSAYTIIKFINSGIWVTGNCINTVEQFKLIPLGTVVYRPMITEIRKYYYAGINPKCEREIMVVSGSNILDISGLYLGNTTIDFYLDYQQACEVLLNNAKHNVEKIQKIYIDKKY